MVHPESARRCFVNNRPEPPLTFESGYFDVVSSFSVFTHLNERLQDLWLLEIARVLKPGGIVILSVHGERAAAGLDKDGAVILREPGYFHRESRKLSGIVPDWYNTSWHSKKYISRAGCEALFSDVRYSVVPDGMQDLVAARKLP